MCVLRVSRGFALDTLKYKKDSEESPVLRIS